METRKNPLFMRMIQGPITQANTEIYLLEVQYSLKIVARPGRLKNLREINIVVSIKKKVPQVKLEM